MRGTQPRMPATACASPIRSPPLALGPLQSLPGSASSEMACKPPEIQLHAGAEARETTHERQPSGPPWQDRRPTMSRPEVLPGYRGRRGAGKRGNRKRNGRAQEPHGAHGSQKGGTA